VFDLGGKTLASNNNKVVVLKQQCKSLKKDLSQEGGGDGNHLATTSTK